MQQQIKRIDGYIIYINKRLGKGSFATVYVGKQESTGDLVAVKILSKDSIQKDQYLKAAVKNQIIILQQLHSQNIVGFQDVLESSKNYYIIQQLCDGDLSDDIKPGYQYDESQAIEMLRQICNGFLTLVREGIIHRDLKPANIMKKGKVLKLGDFGFARQTNNGSMVSTCVGTPLYMSLQILKGESYTSKCDIWALGFIFYQILHGTTPWMANREAELVKNIQSIKLRIKRKDLSAQTQDFLESCLQLNQEDRISWDSIFRHPIFNGYFTAKVNKSQQFENKMKMIMNKLRFYISQKNLDLNKIMNSMGFAQEKQEVSYQDFYKFFKRVDPDISQEETNYMFRKTDTDGSGSISIAQLKNMLLQNGIKLDSQFQQVPVFQKHQGQTFNKISVETSTKIKNCFEKLYRIITRNNLTLWKIFNDFDKKKGSLNLQEFASLLKKISSRSFQITDEEIRSGFDLIDEDGSNSIQFEELNKYYTKINGILPTSDKIQQPIQPQEHRRSNSRRSSNTSSRRPSKQKINTNRMEIEQDPINQYPPQQYPLNQNALHFPQNNYVQQYPPGQYNPQPYQPPYLYGPQNNHLNQNMRFSTGYYNNNNFNGNMTSSQGPSYNNQNGYPPNNLHGFPPNNTNNFERQPQGPFGLGDVNQNSFQLPNQTQPNLWQILKLKSTR